MENIDFILFIRRDDGKGKSSLQRPFEYAKLLELEVEFNFPLLLLLIHFLISPLPYHYHSFLLIFENFSLLFCTAILLIIRYLSN